MAIPLSIDGTIMMLPSSPRPRTLAGNPPAGLSGTQQAWLRYTHGPQAATLLAAHLVRPMGTTA